MCEGGRLVVGVEPARIGEDPGMAAREGVLLKADAGVFDVRDDTVETDAHKGDNGGTPVFDFGFEAPAGDAKLVFGEFIRASGRAIDDIGDAEFEIEKKIAFEGGEKTRRKPPPWRAGQKRLPGRPKWRPMAAV